MQSRILEVIDHFRTAFILFRNMTKTRLLLLFFLLTIFLSIKVAGQNGPGMFSEKPALRWQDGLISGNGRMGILVFGEPSKEKVIFNHENDIKIM